MKLAASSLLRHAAGLQASFVRLGLVALLGACEVYAFTPQSFDLDKCVESADLIVRGELSEDGVFKVNEVVKGGSGAGELLRPRGAVEAFRSVRQALQSSQQPAGAQVIKLIDAVAFFPVPRGREKELLLMSHELVAFQDNAVVSVEHGFGFSRSASFTKESFVAALRTALGTAAERERLLATPRSLVRTRALIELGLRRGRELPLNSEFTTVMGFHFDQLSRGLRGPSADEGDALLRILRGTKEARDQVVLFELAGRIGWNGGFDVIAPFLDRGQPAEVRRSAMRALGQVDRFRAVDHLVPLLTLDEPELWTVLVSLGPVSSPPQDRVLNIDAVEPLARLGRKIRVRHRTDRHGLGNESSVLAHQLERHFHPRLVGLMYEWSLSKDHMSSDSVHRTLKRLTGLELDLNDSKAWHAWWEGAQPVLEQNYDLRTGEGCAKWLAAWQTADPATRNILMRLWFFEPEIDERALLETAHDNTAARHLLAELWQRKRLASETRKAIVERFLHFKLIEEDVHTATFPTWRSYGIAAETDFPFPADSWVGIRSNTSLTEREPKIDESDSGGSTSLQGAAQGKFRGMGGGSWPGAPLMRGVIELREVDHQNGGKVLWTLRWTPEPLRLKRLPE